MTGRRIIAGWLLGIGLSFAPGGLRSLAAAEGPSKLAAEVARAERILIGIPEKKGVETGGDIDVAPGQKFFIEIQRALRGTGRKSAQALIINGGDEKQHPKFKAGKPYAFLLKRDADGKGWVHVGVSEMPVKEGKVQLLAGGKVVEQMAVAEFEELAAKNAPEAAENGPTRDTLTGNWIVVLSDKGADAHLWLVELTADVKAGTEARLLSTSRLLPAAALKSSSIAGDEVHLVFDSDGAPIDFQGRFQEGVVRGNAMSGRTLIVPARMVPTDLKNMRKYDEPLPDPAREEFVDAAGQDESFGALSRFVRRHPRSPLAIAAYRDLIIQSRAEGYDREKFEKLAGEYVQASRRWGPRLETRAHLEMGMALSRREYLPEVALEHLNAADRAFDADSPEEWKRVVAIERGKRLIGAGTVEEGVVILNRIREEYPFEADVIYALARQAEKEKRSDDALALYGEIATLPLLERTLLENLKVAGRALSRDEYPSRIVSRLWMEKHGDRQGLAEWLAGVYASRSRAMAVEKRPPRQKGEGTRVVLVELFTNGDCEPCIAADMAVAGLEATYSCAEVIVLRYHQHQPGPDPLANEEAVDRFKQYNGTGTPTLLVNGRRFAVGGGPLSEAPGMYRALRSYIDPLLEEKIELRLEASVKIERDKAAISVRGSGLTEFPAKARLMMVLAEEKIECVLRNGVRTHEMIVRTFPGTLAGIPAAKGELAYTGEVDLAKVKKKLAQHLAAVQREHLVEFDEKPLELKALQLVVMLQDSESGEVLQATAVPVRGSSLTPADAKSSGPGDTPKKPASAGN